MDGLILKYLRGELSLEEQHRFTKWLEEDEARVEMLSKFERYWESTRYDFSQESAEVLESIRSRISHPEKVTKSFKISAQKYLKYAAIFFIVSLSTLFIYDAFDKESPAVAVSLIEKTSLAGQKITVKLPDGSTVKLNAESKIIVPQFFEENSRQVELIGEAFFDIVPDASRPFTIKVQDLKVKVLGTSFNINAYPEEVAVSVAVKSGRVEVKELIKNTSLVLLPQEMAVYTSENNQLLQKVIDDDQLVFAWTEQRLVFKDSDIEEVLKTLSRWYNVEFVLKKKLDDQKKFTANYQKETLKVVLESLAYAYDFEYEQEDGRVIIK